MSEPLDPLLDAPGPDAGVATAGGSSGRAPDGHPELPGADRPHWLVPALAIAFGSLIAGLVIFGQSNPTETVPTADGTAAEEAEVDTAVRPEAPGDPLDAEPGADQGADEATPVDGPASGRGDPGTSAPAADVGVVDPIGDAAAEAAGTVSTPEIVQVDLPPAGTIRVGDSEFPLVRSCVGFQPLAPTDTVSTVSAHVFRPDGEREQVVERWFTADGDNGVRIDGPGSAGLRQIDVGDADGSGAFAASFEQPDGGVVDLVVNPLPEAEQDCGQVVVTNEPGQFAFPYSRAAMSACVAGDPVVDGRIVAILTEGGRMIAEANGDDTYTLTLRTVETLLSPPLELTDPSGSLFVDGERYGYSGLVTDGETSRDLTFDVDVAGARPCTDGDG